MRLIPQNRVIFNSTDGYAYSFWFYDNNSTAGDVPSYSPGVFLQGQTSGQISGVTFLPATKTIQFRTHGRVDDGTDATYYDPNIVVSKNVNFEVIYEYRKLYNILYLKKPGATSYELWVNGKIAAYNTNTVTYYPDPGFDWIIDPLNAVPNVSVGDLAYWDEDISDIAEQVYNNGIISNWMNLSKKPKHYWRLGESSGLTTIPDIGTDGTNYFESNPPINYDYVLASVDGTNNGYKFGNGNNTTGFSNRVDPHLTGRTGDIITFTNNTGGHPLAICKAIYYSQYGSDINVATESSSTNVTSWTPSEPGVYRYYCASHPIMGAEFTIFSENKYSQIPVLTSN